MLYNLTIKDLQGNILANDTIIRVFNTTGGYTEYTAGVINITLSDNSNYSVEVEHKGQSAKFALSTGTINITSTYYMQLSKTTSFGITIDLGSIPRNYNKFTNAKMTSFGITIDLGSIPSKNYFKTKMVSFGITLDTGVANLNVQIL